MAKNRIIILSLIIVTCTILVFSHQVILQAVGDFLVIRDKIQPADIIHVIAGEDHRTEYAIALFKKGYGKQLFFTGGWCDIHKDYHGEHAKKIALQKGLPPDAVATDDANVNSTYSEAVRLKYFIDHSKASVRSVIVVSDPYHMRRARWAYKKVLGDGIKIYMAPVPYELSPYQKNWSAHKKTREFVYKEYLKILYYHARYQLSWGALRDWLKTFDKY
jgi:uncharacterized SAM-binding protein YcdF (DUF218 family)